MVILLEISSDLSCWLSYMIVRNCPASSKKKCSLKVEVGAGERNWTLTAQNTLGKVELTDRADLMKRGIILNTLFSVD